MKLYVFRKSWGCRSAQLQYDIQQCVKYLKCGTINGSDIVRLENWSVIEIYNLQWSQ